MSIEDIDESTLSASSSAIDVQYVVNHTTSIVITEKSRAQEAGDLKRLLLAPDNQKLRHFL